VQYSLHQVSKLSTANRSCIKVKYSATLGFAYKPGKGWWRE
jgi:hypothetical protein